ncbi:tetratricopeptide repeat protein [Streptomyces sp. 4N509B]|uniref:tetratricopeptide repeat protein n=1 Tax=Streptomyces sp. 4N509B TaxID=3457413 RepID=UPI003FD3215F
MPVVEAVWNVSYASLPPRAARLLRYLADHPTAHFPAGAAVAALGEGQDAADDAVDALETAHLLEVRLDGHLHLPSPVRAHARECARRDGDPEEVRAATLRVLRWYRRQAERADRLAAGPRMRLAEPLSAVPHAPDVPLADETEALRWLERERSALYGSVRLAHALGGGSDGDRADDEAWSLCEPLWTHFLSHRHRDAAVAAFTAGVRAAGRAGRPAARVRMRCQLARPLWEQGRLAEARHQVDRAVKAAERLGAEAGDARLLPSTYGFRGSLLAAGGDWDGAAAAYAHARRLYREVGDDHGVLLLTHLLGRAAVRRGDAAGAVALLREALASARAQRRGRLAARAAYELGVAYRELGEAALAAEQFTRAMAGAGRHDAGRSATRAARRLAAGPAEGRGEEAAVPVVTG